MSLLCILHITYYLLLASTSPIPIYSDHRLSLIAMAEHGSPSSSRRSSSGSVASSFTSRYNNPELVEALSGLAIDTEQRDAIAAFVRATRQPVEVAIETLQDCGWNLLEAIGQFVFEDERDLDNPREYSTRDGTRDSSEQDEEDDGVEPIRPRIRWRQEEPSPEPRGSIEQNEEDEQDEEDDGIEPIRPQIHRRNREPSPEPRRRFSAGAPSDEFLIRALERATARNGLEHPRSVRAVVEDPVAVEYAPLSFYKRPAPMFISPYQDKLWYTGFMKP